MGKRCRECCTACGPVWTPLCFLTCLPCCFYCSCMDPYGQCRLRRSKPFRITQETLTPEHMNVRKAFEANFERGLERGAQLVVYENGVKTIDLAGITLPENPLQRPYDGDSLSLVWSSGKVLASLAMCILADRGVLEYEAKVSEYWPEFAANGKSEIRVQDVLRHDAGLQGFSGGKLAWDEAFENIGNIIADSTPLTKIRVYHAITRGLILNQICVRVDPQGRTIGQILKEEVFEKIGLPNDLILGKASREAASRVHPCKNKSDLFAISQVFCPACMNCNMPWTNTCEADRSDARKLFETMAIKNVLIFQNQTKTDMEWEQTMAADEISDFENPSAWVLASARGLAKCGALLSQGGIIDGVRILKESTIKYALSCPIIMHDVLINKKTAFTKGGFFIFGWYDRLEDIPDEKAYGWGGINGSMFIFEYPGGKAVGYNCSGAAGQCPNDIRGAEILRQLRLDVCRPWDGPTNFKVPAPKPLEWKQAPIVVRRRKEKEIVKLGNVQEHE